MKNEDDLFDMTPFESRPVENPGATMSSLEIAALCDKEHGHVMRDIRAVLEEAGIGHSRFGSSYLNSQNKAQPCYLLPRRECDLVVSGYSVKYRLAIIDRWRELEKQAQRGPVLPSNFIEALEMLVIAEKSRAALSLENAAMAPKADFYDTVVASDDLCQIATVTAVLGLPFGRNTLFQRLRNRGMLISGGDRHNLPKQKYIQQGLFSVKESAYLDAEKQPHVRYTTYATQKGLAWLKREFLPPAGGAMPVSH